MRLFIRKNQTLFYTVLATLGVCLILIMTPLSNVLNPTPAAEPQSAPVESERYSVTYTLPNGQTQVNSYAAHPEEVRESAEEVQSSNLPVLPLPEPWFDARYQPVVNKQLSLFTKVVGYLQGDIALNLLTAQEYMAAGEITKVLESVSLLQSNLAVARADHADLANTNERLAKLLIEAPVETTEIQSSLQEYVSVSEAAIMGMDQLLSQYAALITPARIETYQIPAQTEIEEIEQTAAALSATLVEHGEVLKKFVATTYTKR